VQKKGNNETILEHGNLNGGIYFCKINNNTALYKTIKLLLE